MFFDEIKPGKKNYYNGIYVSVEFPTDTVAVSVSLGIVPESVCVYVFPVVLIALTIKFIVFVVAE